MQTRQALRAHIRCIRQSLDSTQQHHASLALVETFSALPELHQAQHIALYLSNDGELDTLPLILHLWQQGKDIYLPVLHPFSQGHLLFLHYTPTTAMTHNRYGIQEPVLDVRHIIPASQLDLICTPLVAFDEQGQRLGMGGGYYDRTLAPWYHHRHGAMPIGLAHDCQRVAQLPTETWDVPLPKIVTPTQIWHWENTR